MAVDPRSLSTQQLVTMVAVAITKYMTRAPRLRDDTVMEQLGRIEEEIDLWLKSKGASPVLISGGKDPMTDQDMRRLCLEFLLKREVTDDDLEQRR